MSSQSAHAPIDLAPAARLRPTLALVLGILAVPGSTVAWDLPGPGGFYIGLPLAIAAIVVGLRARRQDTGKGRATTGIVLAALCIAQMAVWTIASLAS